LESFPIKLTDIKQNEVETRGGAGNVQLWISGIVARVSPLLRLDVAPAGDGVYLLDDGSQCVKRHKGAQHRDVCAKQSAAKFM
jgi:hypothetical protein